MPITSATTGVDPAMQQLWAREMKKEKRKQAAQEAAEVAGEGATLRQKVAAARLAKEAKEKQSVFQEDGIVFGVGSSLLKSKFSDYILDSIPGVGPFRILKNFLSGRKVKISLGRIFIMLFTNIEFVVIILAVLAFITMIIYFMDTSAIEKVKIVWSTLKAIFTGFLDLGWGAIKALVDLFKDAYTL